MPDHSSTRRSRREPCGLLPGRDVDYRLGALVNVSAALGVAGQSYFPATPLSAQQSTSPRHVA